ncbi:MAG: hypothetical protein CVU90_05825 [Firmicutes bacterium HGW-Firmicutes-15]|nr:MAG: hypothetical protein CVU90_05825 [Firmicutes bacterium HGW-Firmicutes-15]
MLSLPIIVLCNNCLKPIKVKQEKGWVEIAEILECWHDTGCWWQGESEKVFYRIHLRDDAIKEIFQDRHSAEWFLYKIYD